MSDELALIKNYDYLLERLYSKLPARLEAKAYDIPELEIEYIGDHTEIRNFAQVCDRLRRDPHIVMRYFLKNLGMPGALTERGTLVIYNKKVKKETLKEFYRRFLNTYVKCQTCGSIDTELHRKGKVWYIRCLACGATYTIQPV